MAVFLPYKMHLAGDNTSKGWTHWDKQKAEKPGTALSVSLQPFFYHFFIKNFVHSLMKIIERQALTNVQQAQIIQLWNKEYPDTLSYQTATQFEDYLNGLKELQHLLLIDEQNTLQGWAITFEREAETWFAIILDSLLHGKGLGSKLLDRLKLKHNVLNGWVIDHDRAIKPDGNPYHSPLGFYLKNGFSTVPGNRLELDKISAVKIVWQKA